MRILIIDPGQRMGYAIIGDKKPVLSGSYGLPGDGGKHLGETLNALEERIDGLIKKHRPGVVGCAAGFVTDHDTPENLIPLFSMMGIVRKSAFKAGVDCRPEIDERAARRKFLGGHVPSGSEKIKEAVVKACRMRGWPCTDHHAGDSLCLGAYLLGEFEPPHETTPLFLAAT